MKIEGIKFKPFGPAGQKAFLSILGITFLSMIGLGWFLSSMIMYPEAASCSHEHIVYCGDPSEQGLDFESFVIATDDQMEIHGWMMPAVNSKNFVILSHGRGSDRREGMRFAKALVLSGINVVAFDYRNAGESSVSFNSLGLLEKRDLEAVVEFVVKKSAEKIGLYGFSQGGATAILAMADNLRISAGAFEGAFSNAEEAVAELARRDYYLPKFPFLDVAFALYRLRTGVSIYEMNPALAISRIKDRPVYLIHALEDSVVGSDHALKLLAKLPSAQSWFFADNNHAQSWQYDRAVAENKITKFFKEAFGR